MKSIFLFPLLLLLSCSGPDKKNGLGNLKQGIHTLMEGTVGDFGLAFRLLDDSGMELFINEKEVFHAASTMKTPVMIEIFKQEREGLFSLDDSVLIHNNFKSIVDGSSFSMDLGVDSQEGLYQLMGQKATVYELMYQMIIKSSNLATNILIDMTGAKNVTQTMRDLGADDIEVLRGVEDLKAFDAGLSNTTNAMDMLVIMEAIATGNAVDQEASQAMLSILYDQFYNDLIPELLPEGVKVAHKTGSITGVQHDAAIVELPDGTRYVLVILSKNLKDEAAGKAAIARISQLIYNYVVQQ
jgi:beta-lactamase class A